MSALKIAARRAALIYRVPYYISIGLFIVLYLNVESSIHRYKRERNEKKQNLVVPE